ncbi:MATE family efflux transporter [Peteryoungia desertarenae]|uniref:Multidrug-efflux transporter n=1 Tax=Peteryoungia desertarenae TaxID=1813451 RepID=A0ABX6QIM0_9HYPH|nr:MATE family efflux transporter [Peteryoungia desertarenae]QLF68292.1 MATE family efflux transporter [Peteryoungia desertarenae]
MVSQYLNELKDIARLAVPIVVGLSTGAVITVTDSIMIAPLGHVPLAAAGLTGAVATVLLAAIYGFLSVVSVRIGNAYGARQGRRVAAVLRLGLTLGTVAGAGAAVIMSASLYLMPYFGQPSDVLAQVSAYWHLIAVFLIPYAVLTVFKSAFEAIDRPWIGVSFGALACVLNIPLNYCLIYGIGPLPPFGLVGAGIASLVAEAIALLAAFAYWRLSQSTLRLRARGERSAVKTGELVREGAPLGVMYVAETAAMAVATMLIGLFGSIALAANQVALSVGTLLYMVPLGVAGAVAIRVAQAAGANRLDRVRTVTFAALGMATVWLAGAAVVLGLYGAEIAALISSDPAVIELAATLFLVFALSQVVDGLQSTLVGALRGLSDTAIPSVISILAYWPIAIPLGWALAFPLGFGPQGIWLGFVSALALAAIALIWRFTRLTRLAG